MKLFLTVFCILFLGCTTDKQECIELEEKDTTLCGTVSTDSLLKMADIIKIRFKEHEEEYVVNLDSLQHLYDDQVHSQSVTQHQYEEQLSINQELRKPRIRYQDTTIYRITYVDSVIHICDTFRWVDTINYTYEFYFNAIMNDTTENYRKKKRKWRKMIEKLNK